jgi:5-(carboxyamino)imidazole ribonucleotide synthase
VTNPPRIAPGATIGIVGGGQLGRMMVLAAAAMGYKTHIFTPERNTPASHVATQTTIGPYQDTNALRDFGGRVDVVTFEFENVPSETLTMLAEHVPVRPNPQALFTTRHRIREKQFVASQGIATAPFAPVRNEEELSQAVAAVGTPAILKTCELGYDGKGQIRIDTPDHAHAAWAQLGKCEAVLEGFVDFSAEASVIVARGLNGHMQCFPLVENIHKNHVLWKTIAPAPFATQHEKEAMAMATTLAEALDVVGLLAVELFVTESGLIVNELAPRPHNSGHWTIEGASTSQFEQHIRAICGWEIGEPSVLHTAEMVNLLGDDWLKWEQYASTPNAHLHLYGKKTARPGRKMGHVTVLTRSH